MRALLTPPIPGVLRLPRYFLDNRCLRHRLRLRRRDPNAVPACSHRCLGSRVVESYRHHVQLLHAAYDQWSGSVGRQDGFLVSPRTCLV